jgi:hypothetical protein
MPGNYTIKVSANGFKVSTSQVQVNSDPTQLMRVALKVADWSRPDFMVSTSPQIDLEEISITTFIPLVELTPFPLKNRKLQGSHFKLMPCLIDISCNT